MKNRIVDTLIFVFLVIKSALDEGLVTVETIADMLEESENKVANKLCGNDKFDINEAMTININFFPDVPFKELFSIN